MMSRITIVLFTICSIIYGIIIGLSPHTPESISGYNTFTGTIISEPDSRLHNTHLTVNHPEYDSDILIFTHLYPKYTYGDTFYISGKITTPKNFTNNRGVEFDYINFLRVKNIEYIMYYPSLDIVELPKKFSLSKSLFILKQSLINKIGLIFPEPHGALIGGLLLGAKQSLGPDLLDAFRISGLIHIVVLSGFNLAIIARFIEKGLFFAGFKTRIILSVILIILFAILVGGGATIVRATIMALISLLALATHNIYNTSKSLFIAGSVMIFHNPLILLHDPSFQLSFLATLGLIYLAPHIEPRLPFIPEKFSFQEIVTATIAAQIAVTIPLFIMTGEISLVSLFANMLVLPIIPLIMLLSFISIILAYIHPIIALPLGYITYLGTSYIFFVVDVISSIPYAVIGI